MVLKTDELERLADVDMIRLRKWFGSRLVEIDTVQLRKQASTGLENELERLVNIDTVRFRKWISSLSLFLLSLSYQGLEDINYSSV